MLERTWAYGTTRLAKVLSREKASLGDKIVDVLVIEDDHNEGHILLGTSSIGEPGDVGSIVFMRGGPNGGYWHFEKEPAHA